MTIESLAYRRRAGLVYPRKKPPYNPLLRPIEDHPLADGLVGYWLFNEAGGDTLHDLSGNGNDGLIYGATWVPGRDGPGLEFNGSSHYAQRDVAPVTSPPFTLCAWFYSHSDIANQTILWIGQKDAENQMYGIRADGASGGDPCGAYSYSAVGGFKESVGVSFTKNTWHHIAGVFESTSSRLVYLDGVPGTEETSTVDVLSPDRFAIGRLARVSPAGYFDGLISSAGIYNRALSAAEIWQLYKEPYYMVAVQKMARLYYEVAVPEYVPKVIMVM